MTYLVTWTAYACAGSLTLLGVPVPLASLPAAAHPALAVLGVCRAAPSVEPYDPARLPEARARIRELGPGAVLLRCGRQPAPRRWWRREQPARYGCEPETVTWVTEAHFGGEP